jgi:2-hydroxychromene-2-carboxylate isomerase
MSATDSPTLYYDLGSPYAYLAVERAAGVLGAEPRLQPILVGGIFVERGHGSWAHTPEREARIREIEERAARYGLAPLAWPPGWPNNTLQAMRAAIWAQGIGAGAEFARAGFRRAFAEGRDLSRLEEVVAIAASIGLPAEDLSVAIAEQATKDRLREATARAWEKGVRGVPSTEVDGEVFFGDDRLEQAAERLA